MLLNESNLEKVSNEGSELSLYLGGEYPELKADIGVLGTKSSKAKGRLFWEKLPPSDGPVLIGLRPKLPRARKIVILITLPIHILHHT